MNARCIEWGGARFVDGGYGKLTKLEQARTGQAYAHRWAWEKFNGPIPKDGNVLHRCDNPPCINPEHLFLGTSLDNHRDMIAKGRQNNQAKTCCPKCGGGFSVNGQGRRYCRPCWLAYQRAYGRRRPS